MSPKENRTPLLVVLLCMCFAMIASGMAVYFYIGVYGWQMANIPANLEQWAYTGDYFGGVLNPIYSFLSLMALLYTVIINQRELSLSNKELREATEASREQADYLRVQTRKDELYRLINYVDNELQQISSLKFRANDLRDWGIILKSRGRIVVAEEWETFERIVVLGISDIKSNDGVYSFEKYMAEFVEGLSALSLLLDKYQDLPEPTETILYFKSKYKRTVRHLSADVRYESYPDYGRVVDGLKRNFV